MPLPDEPLDLDAIRRHARVAAETAKKAVLIVLRDTHKAQEPGSAIPFFIFEEDAEPADRVPPALLETVRPTHEVPR